MARHPASANNSGMSPLHLARLVAQSVPPMHPAGRPFVAAALGTAALGRKSVVVRSTGIAAAISCLAFFRHPQRVTPVDTRIVVAAADGEIALVDRAVPPAELKLGSSELLRVSTFLSVLDVHVQRSPVSGVVRAVEHRPGQFLSADLSDASIVNERNSVVIDTPDGSTVTVVQIAGLIARRIRCEATVDERLNAGDTYGIIRFGSRVDIYLPQGSTPEVLVGQRSIGGETIIARLP